MSGKDLLDKMAKVKAEIQGLNLWVDNARTNRIARIRYGKVKERVRELVACHKGLTEEITIIETINGYKLNGECNWWTRREGEKQCM